MPYPHQWVASYSLALLDCFFELAKRLILENKFYQFCSANPHFLGINADLAIDTLYKVIHSNLHATLCHLSEAINGHYQLGRVGICRTKLI